MFANTLLGVLLGTLLLIASIPDAVSYSKYGRTCRDIGCLSDEVCVMAEDPCTPYSDKCGRYPTCRKARAGEASCASTVCQENAYCKVENGAPKCVKKDTSVVIRNSTRRPAPPPPPPRSSSNGRYNGRNNSRNGGRNSGYSGSRNTIGDGSIFNRLFDGDRRGGSRGQPIVRLATQREGSGYHNSRVSVDAQGNRVWTFSG